MEAVRLNSDPALRRMYSLTRWLIAAALVLAAPLIAVSSGAIAQPAAALVFAVLTFVLWAVAVALLWFWPSLPACVELDGVAGDIRLLSGTRSTCVPVSSVSLVVAQLGWVPVTIFTNDPPRAYALPLLDADRVALTRFLAQQGVGVAGVFEA